MATNSSDQERDDTAYLIVIVLLVVLLLGLAPIVTDMYLETKTALAELKDEKKSLQRMRREFEQQQRKGKKDE
jgi:outer membrane lipoprotein-sorting protein